MNELFETRQLKISDLITNTKNPRKIKQVEKQKLWLRIQKYGMIGIPAMDADGTLLSGHQRCQILRDYGFDDTVVDVRVAKRKLTEPELKEVMIIENSHAGEFDLNMLHQEFEDFVNLGDYHIDIDELNKDLVEMADAIEESEPEMPIVPKYSEKYSAVVIVIENSIDENFVRESLGLGAQKDYKTNNVGETYVLTAKQFTERWQSK
jgi:hypothetical protein